MVIPNEKGGVKNPLIFRKKKYNINNVVIRENKQNNFVVITTAYNQFDLMKSDLYEINYLFIFVLYIQM